MNDAELKEFEAKAVLANKQSLLHAGDEYADDVPELVTEIRRLRAACVAKDEALKYVQRYGLEDDGSSHSIAAQISAAIAEPV